jgi:hypothetical protein
MKRALTLLVVLVLGVFLVASLSTLAGLQAPRAQIALDGDDIGGVVTGSRGPEAGVWVIAETTELNTKLVKIVVTDDGGRYVVPDLPRANTHFTTVVVAEKLASMMRGQGAMTGS